MQAIFNQLEQQIPGGYLADGPPATEPTAWAAIALATAGRRDAAGRAADWLADQQARDGSLGVTPDAPAPQWPTSLAILAWHHVGPQRYREPIERAVAWCLRTEGTTSPQHAHIGHDTNLVGWSWAADTHSWLEPTAFAVLALRATGHGAHPRCTEAVRLLQDRLLPGGGCNYGNTLVLGQTLLPHLQPSGVVAWALVGTAASDPRLLLTLDYLEREVARPTGSASLAFALVALAAWGRRPAAADSLIDEALRRSDATGSTYKLALLTLAAQPFPATTT